MEITIQMKQVNKLYGDQHIVKNLDLTVYKGEFLTLLGPSGCGKTTTLRMLAGFESPTDGVVLLNGKDIVGVPPFKRDVNTVFQNYALFPHMTVRENIGYGLKMKKVKKSDIAKKVEEILQLVQMEAFADRKPRQLSGGQQQRVAIGRALINNPTVLLLDEPLGALDLKLRKQMQFELKHLQQKLGITFIYVTHDQEEALTMSDRVAVMNKGRIEQIDTPKTIYHSPKTRFVADFIGETNLLQGLVTETSKEGSIVQLEDEHFSFSEYEQATVSEEVHVSIRPEHVTLHKVKVEERCLEGKVTEIVFAGSVYKTIVTLASGKEIIAIDSNQTDRTYEIGETVFLTWDQEKAAVLAS